MPRTHRTIEDLAHELAARSEWLGKSAGLLRRASDSLSRAANLPMGSLDDLMKSAGPRLRWLAAARTDVRKAQDLLTADVKGLDRAAKALERISGERRRAGRPEAMTRQEVRAGCLARKEGNSWGQVRTILNAKRRKTGQPLLPLTTVRTAVQRYMKASGL